VSGFPVSGGGGAVASVSNADGTLTISPTTGAVVASRAALTGDVAASAGSNATTLQNTTAVQNVVELNPSVAYYASLTYW
jgi:hypothetical protein